jgi:ADP-ribosylglycohydrolase
LHTLASTTSYATGSLYGLAFGDAIGDPIEFVSYKELRRRFPSGAPVPARKLRITDDTQMSLAVWQALTVAGQQDLPAVRSALIDAFLAWRIDPDNNRAPGATCMGALGQLSRHRNPARSWGRATIAASAGCGAVMRAPWIGLHPAVDPGEVSTIAKMQAALTHGHPEATAVAAAAAELTVALSRGDVALVDAPTWLLEWARAEWLRQYDSEALGKLHRRCAGMTATEYHQRGAWAVAEAAHRARDLATQLAAVGPFRIDVCAVGGQGWKSADCLATAAGVAAGLDIECDGLTIIRQAAYSHGDSDSIAAVCGALVGAARGLLAEHDALVSRLEPRYRRELAAAASEVRAAEVSA